MSDGNIPKIILLDQLKVERIECTISEKPFEIICFEREVDCVKETKETDIIAGTIVHQLNGMLPSFLKNVLLLAKRKNPKLQCFLFRKKL